MGGLLDKVMNGLLVTCLTPCLYTNHPYSTVATVLAVERWPPARVPALFTVFIFELQAFRTYLDWT